MKCYNCKAIIPEGVSFCPQCGRAQIVTEKLINAAKGGDQSALSDLYNRTYSAVYNTVKFLVRDEDAALDILQDSYVKAFSSLEQLQDAGKFEPWIKRIAHNKAVDYLRQAKPIVFSDMVSDDSEEALEFEDERPENLPEVVIDRRETTRLINEILDSLPEEQLACISLFYYDQLSVKEIAAELGIPEATVKSRLQYGRKKIEAQVKELEKKGTKLYGLAPIPLLMLLLRQQFQAGELPSQTVLQTVLAQSADQAAVGTAAGHIAGAAAREAAGYAAKTAAKGAAKGIMARVAAKAAAARLIAVLAGVAVLGGGTAAVVSHIQQKKQEAIAAATTQYEETEIPETRPVPETPPVPDIPPAPTEPEVPEETSAIPTEPEPMSEIETEATEESSDDMFWVEEYEAILEGYRRCLAEGLEGSSPYLRYGAIRSAIESKDGSLEIQYGLYDVNTDGVPEMILALRVLYDEENMWWNPFEIYSYDEVNRFSFHPFPEILKEYESLYIGADGTMWITSGNSGFNTVTFYSFPQNTYVVEKTDVFEPVSEGGGNDFYRHITPDGSVIEVIPKNEFWTEHIPDDAEITWYSLSEPVSADLVSAKEDPLAELTAYIKSQLGIPEDLETEDKIGWDEAFYWEVGNMWLINCEFFHNGNLVAAAMVDRETGDPARNIMMYTGD